MRMSCCAYSYRKHLTDGSMTLEGFVDEAAALTCDGVELTSYYFPATDDAYLDSIRFYVHDNGLVVSGTAIGTDFAQPDAGERKKHILMTQEWIGRTARLGAPTLRVFAGGLRDGVAEADAFRATADSLAACCDTARKHGVVLALENHGGITSTASQTLALMRAVDSRWLRLNLDMGNFTGDPYAQIEECAPFAVAAHAKITWQGGSGRKEVDYSRVVSILRSAGYTGFLAIEYEEPEEPRTGIPRFAATLRRALGEN